MSVRLAKELGLAVIGIATLVSGVATFSCDSLGCDPSTEGNPPADYKQGEVLCSGNAPYYETSAWDGQYLNFSAGAQFRIFHRLGGIPQSVELYVSFSPTGSKNGNVASPAGNMAEIEEITDQYVVVHNDSCGDYWLRVVVRDAVPDPDGGTPDGGSPPMLTTCP